LWLPSSQRNSAGQSTRGGTSGPYPSKLVGPCGTVRPHNFVRSSTDQQSPAKWYAPLRDKPALFRTFADTPVTMEGVLEFANRYGMLGGVHADPQRQEGQSGFIGAVVFESITAWAQQILLMRQAVALADIAAAGDSETLRNLFFWDTDALIYNPWPSWFLPDWRTRKTENVPDGAEWLKTAGLDVANPVVVMRESWNRNYFRQLTVDPVGAAVLAVGIIVNNELRGAVSPRLAVDLKTGKQTLRYLPENLISALWFQIADAVSMAKRFQRCKWCQEWFEIPLRGARISRVYCSNSCRTRAYRERVGVAKRLREQGKSVKEIAVALATDVKTVKHWLADKKGG
jgi:hypothetical protein